MAALARVLLDAGAARTPAMKEMVEQLGKTFSRSKKGQATANDHHRLAGARPGTSGETQRARRFPWVRRSLRTVSPGESSRK